MAIVRALEPWSDDRSFAVVFHDGKISHFMSYKAARNLVQDFREYGPAHKYPIGIIRNIITKQRKEIIR